MKKIGFWLMGLLFIVDLFTISLIEALFYLIFKSFIIIGKKYSAAINENFKKYQEVKTTEERKEIKKEIKKQPLTNIWIYLLRKINKDK